VALQFFFDYLDHVAVVRIFENKKKKSRLIGMINGLPQLNLLLFVFGAAPM
jgi:hypothetical protein